MVIGSMNTRTGWRGGSDVTSHNRNHPFSGRSWGGDGDDWPRSQACPNPCLHRCMDTTPMAGWYQLVAEGSGAKEVRLHDCQGWRQVITGYGQGSCTQNPQTPTPSEAESTQARSIRRRPARSTRRPNRLSPKEEADGKERQQVIAAHASPCIWVDISESWISIVGDCGTVGGILEKWGDEGAPTFPPHPSPRGSPVPVTRA